MSDQPVLHAVTDHGDPVILRPAELRDVDAIFETCLDPESREWTTIPLEYTRERAVGWVQEYAPGFWERGDGAVWVIADGNGDYAGQLDLRIDPKDKQVADIGFMMSPRARGNGYMTAALRAVLHFGFGKLGLERIEWRAHVGNVGSRRAAEKAGFRFEGVLRNGSAHRGERRDTWIAAVIREDMA